MRRRQFLMRAGLISAAGVAPRGVLADRSAALRARPFPLSRVRLLPGLFREAVERNHRFVMDLEPDRLLHTFRLSAGLPSQAEPLGGWERPDNELRGHFTGHYLSACAMLQATLGEPAVKARGELVVAELAKCQSALGSGYLSAFPEEFFDRLRRGEKVWAPFYTLHKIMAGLLDMHVLAGSGQALAVLEGLAAWTGRFVQPLGEGHMARVLEREYGGMNEVLYNLGAVTGNASYHELAQRFDHERVFAPLAEGRDELKGLHANTTIPKIIGAARRYELSGERRYRELSEYFWRTVTSRRSYCTGGTSNEESWRTDPGSLAAELSGYTQECCCTYNMLRLTRHVFSWTADPLCADYYERALWNGVLGTQHPADGMTLYYVPLASGYWKLFGLPRDAFWCCTGSGLESFSKLQDSVYYQDEAGLFVNLFVPTSLDWPERGLTVVQETRFPEEDRTRLLFRTREPQELALRVRVPAWSKGGAATLNGRPLEGFASPGSYFVLERRFRDKDVLEVRLPMALRECPMPDDPSLVAAMHGPIVLAGRLGSEGLSAENLRAEPTKPRTVPEYRGEPRPAAPIRASATEAIRWLHPVPGMPLQYETLGQDRTLRLEPLYRIFDERYAVYWKVAGA